MLIRGQTTEQRIAEIASGFGKGLDSFNQGQNQQRAQSLQDEASKRQQAIQAFEIESKLSEQTGQAVPQGTGAAVLNGMPVDFSALKAMPKTAKAEAEARKVERENLKFQQEQEETEYKRNQRTLPVSQRDSFQEKAALNVIKTQNKPTTDSRLAQKQMEKLGVGNAGLYNVKSAMDEALKILEDKSISEDQKIKTGQSLFKLLNSAEGSDAVGAEEAKRLGSYLEYNLGNFTQPGAFVGRDLGGFTDQVRNYSTLLGGRMQKNEEGINTLRGGGTLGSLNQSVSTQQAAPKYSPVAVKKVKSMSLEELDEFVNGGK